MLYNAKEQSVAFDPLNQSHTYYDNNGQPTNSQDSSCAFCVESNGLKKYFVRMVGGSLFDKNRTYMRGLTDRFSMVEEEFFNMFVQYLQNGTPGVYAYLKDEFMIKGY